MIPVKPSSRISAQEISNACGLVFVVGCLFGVVWSHLFVDQYYERFIDISPQLTVALWIFVGLSALIFLVVVADLVVDSGLGNLPGFVPIFAIYPIWLISMILRLFWHPQAEILARFIVWMLSAWGLMSCTALIYIAAKFIHFKIFRQAEK